MANAASTLGLIYFTLALAHPPQMWVLGTSPQQSTPATVPPPPPATHRARRRDLLGRRCLHCLARSISLTSPALANPPSTSFCSGFRKVGTRSRLAAVRRVLVGRARADQAPSPCVQPLLHSPQVGEAGSCSRKLKSLSK